MCSGLPVVLDRDGRVVRKFLGIVERHVLGARLQAVVVLVAGADDLLDHFLGLVGLHRVDALVAALVAELIDGAKVHLSLSHDAGIASAMVVIEK